MTERDYLKFFYQAVDVQQGIDERWESFYVPIYDMDGMTDFDLVPKMNRVIRFSAGQSVQLLSGFRGCGKTSELKRLQRDLQGDGYRVAYMDIEDYFNTHLPLDAARLPIALAAGFATAVDHDPTGSPRRRFFEFLKRVRPELSASFGVEGAQLDVKAVVRDDNSFAAAASSAFRDNRRVLREEFHAYFRDLLAALPADEPVVFIVDSIDHWRGSTEQFEGVRESVEDAFTELADDLRIPNLHVIYTVPIYLDVPGFVTRYDIVNVKLTDRAGALYQPGQDAMRAVLTKRAPGGDLARFAGAAEIDRIIGSSGGHFRDLLRLVREVILGADRLPAQSQVISRAEMTLREGYKTTLTREQLELLRHVADTKTTFSSRAQTSDEAALISLGAVLRYPNAQATWYDVHPLLRPLL